MIQGEIHMIENPSPQIVTKNIGSVIQGEIRRGTPRYDMIDGQKVFRKSIIFIVLKQKFKKHTCQPPKPRNLQSAFHCVLEVYHIYIYMLDKKVLRNQSFSLF